MKIALITSDAKRGGIAVAFLNYLTSLLKTTTEVLVCVPSKSHLSALLKEKNFSGMTIMEMSPFQIRLLKWGYLPSSLKRTVKECQVIINNNNFMCRPLVTSGLPVISICHSDKPKGLEYADCVITMSSGGADLLARAGIALNKIVRLPHYYTPTCTQNLYNAADKEPLIISAAGRFVPKKGFQDFIDAAALLKEAYGDKVTFWLAGEGELGEDLRTRSKETSSPVEFKGWMETKVLATQTDIFCLPSHAEPFGYVLSEFMEHGVPCVVTNTNGPVDITGNGKAALVYPKGDVDSLVVSVSRLIESAEERTKFSERAFSRIREPDFTEAQFDEGLHAVIARFSPEKI